MIAAMGEHRLPYSPALDGVRAIAIILVVLVHAGVEWVPGGFLGVDVFFVLSGYLITRLLRSEQVSEGRLNLLAFYLRRLRRLYPALLLLLASYMIFWPIVMPGVPASKNLLDVVISAVYLSDYSRSMGIEVTGLSHLWSLSIEEHFYLIWPILLVGLSRLDKNYAIVATSALFVAASVWRYFAFEMGQEFVYYRFDTRLSGIALGCVAALSNVRLSPMWGRVGIAGIFVMAFSMRGDGHHLYAYGFTAAEFFSVLIVLGLPKELAIGAWLGRMSYGLYLWHVPIITACRAAGLTTSEQLLYGGFGGLLMSCMSYYTVESYFRHKPRTDSAILTQATR